jgi:hypothetical protein
MVGTNTGERQGTQSGSNNCVETVEGVKKVQFICGMEKQVKLLSGWEEGRWAMKEAVSEPQGWKYLEVWQ